MTSIEGSTRLPQAEMNRRQLLDKLVLSPTQLSDEEVSKLEDFVGDLNGYVEDLNNSLGDLRASRGDEDSDDEEIEQNESDASYAAVEFQKELKEWLIP